MCVHIYIYIYVYIYIYMKGFVVLGFGDLRHAGVLSCAGNPKAQNPRRSSYRIGIVTLHTVTLTETLLEAFILKFQLEFLNQYLVVLSFMPTFNSYTV